MGPGSPPSHSSILCPGPLGLTWWTVVSGPVPLSHLVCCWAPSKSLPRRTHSALMTRCAASISWWRMMCPARPSAQVLTCVTFLPTSVPSYICATLFQMPFQSLIFHDPVTYLWFSRCCSALVPSNSRSCFPRNRSITGSISSLHLHCIWRIIHHFGVLVN